MTPQLRAFLGGDAAEENLRGVRNGDHLFVVADQTEYLHRGYIVFHTRQSRIIGDPYGLPLIAYCYTSPKARGRGLYQRALNAELSYLRTQGHKRALIETEPSNTKSRKGIGAGFSRTRLGSQGLDNLEFVRRSMPPGPDRQAVAGPVRLVAARSEQLIHAITKVRVYFTVDTETSMGGAWRNAGPPLPLTRTVFGEHGDRGFGISLIMDILERYGFTATFFVEVFCSYFVGAAALQRVFETIQKRGHDAQLHLHPVYRFYHDYLQGQPAREKDLFHELELEEQRQLLQEGVALFRQLSGAAPLAFRAGCFGASEVTLGLLRENGVLIDSSYNLCYLDQSCGFRRRLLNAPLVMEGIHEFPVTNFSSFGRESSYKPLDIAAVSVSEIIATIRQMHTAGCSDVVLVFHSFSFLKRRGIRFERSRPDRIVITRFCRLCEALLGMRDEVEVRVLANADLSSNLPSQPQVIPSLGWLRPAVRKAVQGLDYIPWI